MIRNSFLFFLLIFIFVSCEKGVFYSEVRSFKNSEWKAKDKKSFDVVITDTSAYYDIVFFMRVGTDFDYNNAWVYLHTTMPDKMKYKEAQQFFVSNEKGEWLGKKSGSLVEAEMAFTNRKFGQAGKYHFVLEQASTQKVLNQVSDVGLKITKRIK